MISFQPSKYLLVDRIIAQNHLGIHRSYLLFMHNFDIEESRYSESLDALGLENDHVLTIMMMLTVETESDTYHLRIESFQNMNEVLLEVVGILKWRMLETPQSYCISINGSVLSLSQTPRPLSRFFLKEGQRFVVKEVWILAECGDR